MTAAGITRFGDPIGRGPAASFRCARCGEAARAGTAVDMGPPLGEETPGRGGLVLDYFLGTVWRAETDEILDAVQALIERGRVDPLAIRRISWALWEITPFYCPDCGLNYCRRDWDTYVWWTRDSMTAPWASARTATGTCLTTDQTAVPAS